MREDLVSIQASNAAYYATLDRKEMLSSANKRLQALAEKQVKLAQLMREIEELEYIRNTDMKVKSNILMLDSEYGLKYDLASQDPFETPAQRENRLRREARAAKKTDDELDDEVSKAADLLQDTTM
jgi:FKBP-type peptidyl-prolyl cis-trans isomerase (trigger factor)